MATDDKRYQALLLAHNASDTAEVVIDRSTKYLKFLDTDPQETIKGLEIKPETPATGEPTP